ncbi:hypothetical protein AB0L00_19735 [Actinoallomurus sp. NPDC052308]|uniref:hypothetical protein n=1 Tax=Actinoallomurus sp. NPDC052308 TaxID=3155530 RepID=UPI00343B182D
MEFLVLATGIDRLADEAHAGWNPIGWVKSLPMWVSTPVGAVAVMTFAVLCIGMIGTRREDRATKTIVGALLAAAVAGVFLVSVLS